MRFILMAAMAVMLTLPAMAAPGMFEKPALYAVTFYSDYCGNCKILDPQIEKARTEAALDKQPILFVTMDFTNKEAINQSKLRAAALGIDGFVKEQGAGTGYMVLLDPATHKELARFTRDSKAPEISEEIQSHLTKAQ